MTYPEDLLNECRLLAAPCDATGLRIVEDCAAKQETIQRKSRWLNAVCFLLCVTGMAMSHSPIETTTFASTQSPSGAQHTFVGGLSAATAGNPRSNRITRHPGEPKGFWPGGAQPYKTPQGEKLRAALRPC